jgi:phosphoglycerate dehydrogenase-like enzyme
LRRFAKAFPESRIVACPDDAGLDEHLGAAEILVGGPDLAPALAARAPRLRWVQTLSVGVDGFLEVARSRPELQVTNVRGVNVTPLAEHALMLMLSFARGMPELARRQAARDWRPPDWAHVPKVFELSGATLGLLGYGEIGRAIAERARAFGMSVQALRRGGAGGPDGFAERIVGPSGLPALLAAADHVVATLPLTAQTHRLMDDAAFARMRPGAFFYNLGRGAVVDHEALIAALRSGRIGGAGLDVVDPEPLPADSPLWSLPNVMITGHTAGFTPRLVARNVEFLEAQLGRWRRGEPLENRIDPASGY